MAEIARSPIIRCDNCGGTADMIKPDHPRDSVWVRPRGWGSARIDPIRSGYYPDNISFSDLCPRCLGLVHAAVGHALSAGRGGDQAK